MPAFPKWGAGCSESMYPVTSTNICEVVVIKKSKKPWNQGLESKFLFDYFLYLLPYYLISLPFGCLSMQKEDNYKVFMKIK